MGNRSGRKLTRQVKARAAEPRNNEVVAVGRIAGGVSETYVAFKAMPSADEICAAAVRKVTRATKSKEHRE